MEAVLADRDTVQSSELSRSSAAVFSAAEDHPVRVTRRDGETLVLMSQREADARSSLLELAAQLIAASTDGDGPLPARLADYFPWMLALNAEDQAACATDLIVSARASVATNQAHLAVAELTARRETATAVVAGLGGADLVWIDEDEPVERP